MKKKIRKNKKKIQRLRLTTPKLINKRVQQTMLNNKKMTSKMKLIMLKIKLKKLKIQKI